MYVYDCIDLCEIYKKCDCRDIWEIYENSFMRDLSVKFVKIVIAEISVKFMKIVISEISVKFIRGVYGKSWIDRMTILVSHLSRWLFGSFKFYSFLMIIRRKS